jgi:hypothetical protein
VDADGSRGRPSLLPQRLLQALRSLNQAVRIGELLDLLPTIGKRKYEFVIVTVHLAANLVQQAGGVALEKPQHRSVYRPLPFQP